MHLHDHVNTPLPNSIGTAEESKSDLKDTIHAFIDFAGTKQITFSKKKPGRGRFAMLNLEDGDLDDLIEEFITSLKRGH